MKKVILAVMAGVLFSLLISNLVLGEEAQITVGKGTLKIGGILQAGYIYNLEDKAGIDAFTLNRVRFLFWGTIVPDKVKYFVQTETKSTTNTVSLLDYKAQFFYIQKTEIAVGRFLPNFTIYMPYPTSKLEMINYPVTSMAEKTDGTGGYGMWRQVGIQTTTTTDYVDFNLGIFNGADIADNVTDNNDAKDFFARADIKPPIDPAKVRFGGYGWMGSAKPPATFSGKTPENKDTVYSVANPDEKSFKKNRFGGFAIADYTKDKLTLRFRGELLMGEDEYLNGKTIDDKCTRKSQSFFAHVGVQPVKQVEFLARYEAKDPDTDVKKDGTSAVTGGVNYYLDGINSMFYLNYIHKMEEVKEIDNDVVQAQVQITF
jgi:hypothetical protein